MKEKLLAILGIIHLPLPIDKSIVIEDNEKGFKVVITVIAWVLIWIIWMSLYMMTTT